MRSAAVFIILSFLLHSASGAGQCTLTRPAQFSILSSNAVQLEAQAEGSQYVNFFASWYDANRREKITEQIASDSSAPFQAFWSCADINDQGWFDLSFFSESYDSQGLLDKSPKVFCILDRNKEISSAVLHSGRIRGKPIQTAKHLAGRNGPAIELVNDDNRCRLYTFWNRHSLFIRAQVKDRFIHQFQPSLSAVDSTWDSLHIFDGYRLPYLWNGDCIALFFDTDNSKSELLDTTDKLLYITPSGQHLARMVSPFKKHLFNWARGIKIDASITPSGSVQDTGYLIEAEIPWKTLGIKQGHNRRIGFELYTVDKDYSGHQRVIGTWAGPANNHLNPSEWGTLILDDSYRYGEPLLLLCIPVVLLTGLLISRKRDPGKKVPALPAAPLEQDGIIARACEFIKTNFKNELLDRDFIAHKLCVSSGYLGTLFKKATGKSISQYINEYRIERASELLLSGSMNVSEVAMETGYKSLDHFIRTFRQIQGITPKQYQKTLSKG